MWIAAECLFALTSGAEGEHEEQQAMAGALIVADAFRVLEFIAKRLGAVK